MKFRDLDVRFLSPVGDEIEFDCCKAVIRFQYLYILNFLAGGSRAGDMVKLEFSHHFCLPFCELETYQQFIWSFVHHLSARWSLPVECSCDLWGVNPPMPPRSDQLCQGFVCCLKHWGMGVDQIVFLVEWLDCQKVKFFTRGFKIDDCILNLRVHNEGHAQMWCIHHNFLTHFAF